MKSIRQLAKRYPVRLLCSVFELPRSCYYAYLARRRRIDVRRVSLRSRINELFSQSRSSAGSRSIVAMLKHEGTEVGRFKVRGLMKEQGLICKQPGSHAYKKSTVERPDIPNCGGQLFPDTSMCEVRPSAAHTGWAVGSPGSSAIDPGCKTSRCNL
ncbi:hypothetical protein CD800_22795 [Pseudomonas aeruginosa]|nr:hypothetical protein CD800_22795 [Pseudomonas aeruginosa]